MSKFKDFYNKYLKPEDFFEWIILVVLVLVTILFFLWVFAFGGYSK